MLSQAQVIPFLYLKFGVMLSQAQVIPFLYLKFGVMLSQAQVMHFELCGANIGIFYFF